MALDVKISLIGTLYKYGEDRMKQKLKIIFLSISLLALSSCGINNIPTYDENVKAKWSDVLNQYKRRADLVPNLVNTVKGYASHEKQTLTEVIKARNAATQMQIPKDVLTDEAAFRKFQKTQDQLSSALARLMVVVERYPQLKANQNFLALQSQLEGTENRISVARRDYIEAVRRYNTELRTFPGRIWKMILYSEEKVKANFTQPESVQSVPEVKF